MNWLKYSGCNITLKLNPYHWRLAFTDFKSADVWDQNALVIELFPITIRMWIDNGEW
jgi:hypothetical protein